MRQRESVEVITKALQSDPAVRAVFLKGSLARGQEDNYSDVDLYCMVKEENKEEFLSRRISHLENYRPLIYWSEANFVGPQIVGVFDNGLHFDLYTITEKTLKYTDEIKVIYDPEQLLSSYKVEKLSFSEDDFVEIIHEFTFTLLEFEAAYNRKDLNWAARLGSHLTGGVAAVLRYLHDNNNALLGMKRLNQYLDKETQRVLSEAMDNLGPSALPKGVIMLSDLVERIINDLPMDTANKINKEFFYFMLNKVRQL